MCLHGDHLVGGRPWLRALDVRVELVERLEAGSAVTAVLEEQDGAIARFGYGGVERLDVVQVCQRLHRCIDFIRRGRLAETRQFVTLLSQAPFWPRVSDHGACALSF